MRAATRTTKNRRILKTRSAAERQVPAVVAEWGEEIADRLYVAFDAENTAWSHDSIVPNGDANYAANGFIRKTDAELQKMEIHIHTSLGITFESPDCLDEIVFNLRSLAEELSRVADALADSEKGGDSDE